MGNPGMAGFQISRLQLLHSHGGFIFDEIQIDFRKSRENLSFIHTTISKETTAKAKLLERWRRYGILTAVSDVASAG